MKSSSVNNNSTFGIARPTVQMQQQMMSNGSDLQIGEPINSTTAS